MWPADGIGGKSKVNVYFFLLIASFHNFLILGR